MTGDSWDERQTHYLIKLYEVTFRSPSVKKNLIVLLP